MANDNSLPQLETLSLGESQQDEVPFSYCTEVGEWKTRKISLIGVAKSFVSQLSVGQDLTRVTLPSVFLHPYSMLEVIAQRFLVLAPFLYGISKIEDPQQRFLQVVRRYLGFLKQEDYEKKPYNPILGETHVGYVQDPVHGRTTCIAEQVSHHPPVAAFATFNDIETTKLEGNISFNVRFGGNSVSVTTEGKCVIYEPDHNESYEMSKCLPDMIITNVILGTKRVFWDGDVTLQCKQTGFLAKLTLRNTNHKNTVEGFITKVNGDDQTVLYKFEGRCGDLVHFWPYTKADEPPKEDAQSSGSYYMSKLKGFAGWGAAPAAPVRDNSQDVVFLDMSQSQVPVIKYLPFKDQEVFSSLKVWREVTKNIIINDMTKADAAKKGIEDAQRKRIAEAKAKGIKFEGKFFTFNEETKLWVFRGFQNTKTENTVA